MGEENSEDLFNIKLDQTGIHYIRKLGAVAGTILGLMMIASLISIATAFYLSMQISRLDLGENWNAFQLRVGNYLNIVILVVNVFSIYYYVKFIRVINYGITNTDEMAFNMSFRYLYINALVFSGLLILNLVYQGMVFYTWLRVVL